MRPIQEGAAATNIIWCAKNKCKMAIISLTVLIATAVLICGVIVVVDFDLFK